MWYMQPSFVSGEMAPSLYGRTDLAKSRSGASVMRNAFVNYRGGILSRPGSRYVGMSKQAAPNAGGTATSYPPRDIKFQFNINQGFDLEFGDQYMRVVSNGAYVTENPKTITGITQANPGVVTIAGHGFNNGDWVYGANIGGMRNFNGLQWVVQNKTTNTFTLTDLFGNTVNTSSFPAFTSGGTFARIYTAASPYAAVDLPYLKYTQSANTMSLTCVNQITGMEYPTYELLRVSNIDWTFTAVTFAPVIAAPAATSSNGTASTTRDTWYSYVATAVDKNGNESIASPSSDVFNNNISVNAGTNYFAWTPVAGAVRYNIYAATPAFVTAPFANPGFTGVSYGYIGSSLGVLFTDTNITIDFTRTPPLHDNPFARGAITFVLPTSAGSGYATPTIGYTINTSTGSGAILALIAQGGGLVGGYVVEGGENYAPSDTITITGGSIQAKGNITFSVNPSDTQTIILNGVTWTFTASAPSGNQTLIGATLAQTLGHLAADLNASVVGGISVANYTDNSTQLFITYNTGGTGGNAYTLNGGTSGAVPSAATLTGGSGSGSGAAALLTIGPQTGTYPGLVSYFQQRRVYANTLNAPDTYFFSRTGSYENFDASIPNVDSDAIIGTPWAQQVNGIQAFLVSPTGLLAFCGNGAWLINGGAATAITPSDQSAQSQAYNGISPFVPPVTINYHILYVQSKGSIVRDLAFNIFVNTYTGEDITIISNHLFSNFTIPQMVYAEEPFKVNWCVRNDGALLSLTYLAEQDIKAWARHDTNGLYVGVQTVTEPPVDAVYVIVQRYVNGHWVYYKERFDNRDWTLAEDCFCVDAGLSYLMTFPNATLYPAAATGSGVSFLASAASFNSGMVGDVIRVGNGQAVVTSYISTTQVITDITQPITAIIPNDPTLTVIPAISGDWSISTPTSIVTGLNHLQGLTVTGLADGGVIAPQVVGPVTGGIGIALPHTATAINVGLPFIVQGQTLQLDFPDQGGTSQSKRKNINGVDIRYESSRGISVGTNQLIAATLPGMVNPVWTDMIEVKESNPDIPLGQAIPLSTGDYFLPVYNDWSTQGRVAFQQLYPLPCNILAIIARHTIGDTSGP